LWEPTKGTARRSQPSYRLTQRTVAALRSALRYRTETIDGDDQKLIRHLRRNGRITNADVRDYLDCDVFLARDRLARMRKRGWIDFLPGGATRGADVVYVTTPKFARDLGDS
jgi:ATP-dependent DNA helicase RecG